MVLPTSAGAPITCPDWDALCVDFLGEGYIRYPYNYVIFSIAPHYFAQNGLTGEIDYGGPANEGGVSGLDAAAVINAAKGAIGVDSASLLFRGNFTVTSTLDFTMIRDKMFTLDLRGAAITALINGAPIFDFTGSHDSIRVLGGWINTGTTPATTPNVGVLMARPLAGWSAGQHVFIGTVFEGYYTNATFYMYGSEENTFIGCYARNREPASAVIDFNADNPNALTSTFTAIAVGDQSSTVLNWHGGHILHYAADGIAVTIRACATLVTSSINFHGPFMGAGATASAIHLDVEENGGLRDINLWGVRITDNVPAYCIFGGNNAAAARTIHNVFVGAGCILQSGTNEIFMDVGVTANRWIVDRTVWNPANNGLSGTYTNCDIYHPSYRTWNFGTATIPNLGTLIAVAHGLGDTPTNIRVTGQHAEVNDLYITNVGVANFTINTAGATTGNRDVYWYAEFQ